MSKQAKPALPDQTRLIERLDEITDRMRGDIQTIKASYQKALKSDDPFALEKFAIGTGLILGFLYEQQQSMRETVNEINQQNNTFLGEFLDQTSTHNHKEQTQND